MVASSYLLAVGHKIRNLVTFCCKIATDYYVQYEDHMDRQKKKKVTSSFKVQKHAEAQ